MVTIITLLLLLEHLTQDLLVDGTVFVHTARPDRPLMVTSVDQEEIHRVDLDGLTKCWGSVDDWREEMRSRTIEEVYHPGKK